MESLEEIHDWKWQAIEKTFEAVLASKNLKAKDLFMPFRIAVTGTKESPPLFETIEVLGKEIVRRRVRLCCEALNLM
jgi:glutamyl-tRNA synthetase